MRGDDQSNIWQRPKDAGIVFQTFRITPQPREGPSVGLDVPGKVRSLKLYGGSARCSHPQELN